MAGKKPDYRVTCAVDADDPESRLCDIGVAFESTSRSGGNRYIQVLLDRKPWG